MGCPSRPTRHPVGRSQQLFEIISRHLPVHFERGGFNRCSPELKIGGVVLLESTSKKILVAERDLVVLAVVNYLLTRRGYQVETHTAAGAAGTSLRSRPFDAALISADFSDMEWMRSIFRDVPSLRHRVILTGAPGNENDLPLYSILAKPIDFTVMLETLQRCLGD